MAKVKRIGSLSTRPTDVDPPTFVARKVTDNSCVIVMCTAGPNSTAYLHDYFVYDLSTADMDSLFSIDNSEDMAIALLNINT
jgi:hypothetical protein